MSDRLADVCCDLLPCFPPGLACRLGSEHVFPACHLPHARLICRGEDSEAGLALADKLFKDQSSQGGALLGGVNALHTSFPENPVEQYRMQCELLLDKLGLQSVLNEELKRLDRLQSQQSCLSQTGEGNILNSMNSRENSAANTNQTVTSDKSDKHVNCGESVSFGAREASLSSYRHPKNNISRPVTKRQDSCMDSGLEWFDSLVPDVGKETERNQVSTINSLPVDFVNKTTSTGTGSNTTLPKGNFSPRKNKSRAKEPQNDTLVGAKTFEKEPISSSDKKVDNIHECSADFTITEQVSKKLRRKHLNMLGEFGISTDMLHKSACLLVSDDTQAPLPDGPDTMGSSSGPIHRTRIRGKRNWPAEFNGSHAGMEEDAEATTSFQHKPEENRSTGPPPAKLARFSFQQKSRLVHPSEENANTVFPPSVNKICNPNQSHKGTSRETQLEQASNASEKLQKIITGSFIKGNIKKECLVDQNTMQKNKEMRRDSQASASATARPRTSGQKHKMSTTETIVSNFLCNNLVESDIDGSKDVHAQYGKDIIQGELKELTNTKPGNAVEKEKHDLKSSVSNLTLEKYEEKHQTQFVNNKAKLSSSTLARLAQFSFSPPLEPKTNSSLTVDVPCVSKEAQGLLLAAHPGHTGPNRKCFELETIGKTSLTCKLLFSTIELDDETLDFDWEEEMKRKPRT